MSDPRTSRDAPPIPRRTALVHLLSVAGLVVLPSCGGGGGDSAGVDTGGTGSFSTGRISGFGSVIVNGVRFEDGAARITDDDDERPLGPQDLKLGMVVRVLAGAIASGPAGDLPTATATAIAIESQIKGPVESKTLPDRLVVFGQQVRVNGATVFEDTTFAAIQVGDALEVSGFLDAAGVVTATRIELENAPNEFKVRGFIADLDAAARTFRIGTARFDFSDPAVRLPDTPLADGQFVRVRTRPARNAAGEWLVLRIDRRNIEAEDRDEAEVEGILVRNGDVLTVAGIVIDVSRLPAGTVLPVGQFVEVEGELAGGVLVAREIEIEDEDEEAGVDVRGTVSALDTAAQTFVVRGLAFHYTVGVVQEKDGTIAANLRVGAAIRVKGTVASGGGLIEAAEIDFRP